jgi:hydrogenase nickel incorporation protein HypA/HybF
MHELSLAEGILRLVQASAVREQFTHVAVLRLEAGALAGVEVGALRFALEALRPGSCLASARIEIDEVPGRAWCAPCAAEVQISSRADPCPHCGGYPVRVLGGDRLRVMDLLVHEQEART